MKTGRLLVGLTVVTAIHATAQEADKVEQYRAMLLKRPENAVLFGRLVDAWLEKGEMAGLKDYLEAKAQAGDAMDWRLLAMFRNFSGDEAGAIAALDQSLAKSPDDARCRLARAKAFGAAARFEEALADLVVAGKNPEVALEAGTLRGKFLARAGRPEEAVKAWKEIIAANPADQGLREDLIDLEIGEGMMEEAVASARELADKTDDPYQKALRRMRVAEILAQAGRKNDAVAEYTEVFSVSAEDSWLEREVLARVSALFTREDDMGGLKDFHQKLRDTWPRRVAVKKEAARSLMATGEGDEGVAMFREVLKVMPGDRAVRDEFIGLLESSGRLKDAADEITALLATEDKDAALWEKLAGIRKAMGDEEGLKKALDQAVALAAKDEAGQVSAAALLERYGQSGGAEDLLRATVRDHGLAGEAGDALAVHLAGHDKAEEAVKLWHEMGKTADREGLMRITRSLTANGHAADAFDILSARLEDFREDPLVLAALCQAAQFSEKAENAIPQALELVKQAKTSGDLENALRQALGIVFRAKEPRKWIDELAAREARNTQELCLLSEMYESLGDSIEAERVLKLAMAGGDPLLAAAQKVRLFELRGDLQAAVAATREWIALPGGMKTEQIKRLVGLYERMDDFESALKEVENWKRIAPGDKIAWTKRADLLRRDGKSEEAVAELRRALAKFGADEEMRANLASTMIEAGLMDEAKRVFESLHDEAESVAAKVKWAGSMADLASQEGQEDELVNGFKRRSRENPSSVAPLLALAEIYRNWQRPDEEMQAVAEASRRKPEDVSLIQRMADLEEQTGSAEKAEALLKSAIRIQDTPDNRRRLSAFWIRNGDSERGLAELLSEKGAASPRDVERMVEPLMVAKDFEASLRILSAEAPRHPEDWRLVYLHALALKESGAKDEAFRLFADLLSGRNEIAGLSPVIPKNPMAPTNRQAEISPFRMFAQFRVLTNSSRNRRMYYGMNQTPLPLPGTVEELHWMAACQALEIAKDNPETRDARLATLSASDLQDFEVIKAAYWLEPGDLAKRLDDDHADPKLFRWYVESANYSYDPFGNRRGLDNKLLRKGVERCAETDPELALQLMGRLRIDGEDGLGAEGARRMLELITARPDDKKSDYCGMLQTLATADPKVVEQDVRDRALAMLLEQLKALREKSGNTWLEQSLALQWMREGRFDEAVEMLNSSYRFGKEPGRNRQARSGYGGYSPFGYQRFYPGNDNELKFPEILTSSVNYQFVSQFPMGGSNRGSRLSDDQKKILGLLGEKEEVQTNGEAPKPIDKGALAKVLSRIEDPFLRIFLVNATEQKDPLAREIEGLEKDHAADAMALMTAAAYHLSVGKNPGKAYELLVAGSRCTKDAGMRSTLDWHVYQVGLQLAGKDEPKVDLDAARRSALRLRKLMGSSDETKQSLAAGLKKLGLEEESRRFVAAPQAIRSYGSRYGGYSMPGRMSQPRNNRQQLTTLVGQGKREAAARLLLRDIARYTASRNLSMGYSNYEENELYSLLTSMKLEDEAAKVAAPPEGAGYKSRRDYALLLSRMNKQDAALPLLRKLAEEKRDDFEVRAALLMALPKDEQRTYVLELPDAKFDPDRIGNWFNSSLERGGNSKIEDFFANVELFILFIEKLPPSFDAERNLSWVNYIAKDLFRNSYFGDIRLKPLSPEDGGNSDKVDEAKSKERDELAKRLYRAMLRHPQTSDQGFILLERVHERLGVPDDDLQKAACDAVTMGFRLKEDPEEMMRYGYGGGRRNNLWVWVSSGGGSRSSGSPAGGLDPMSYLLRDSAEGKGNNPVSPEALAKLAESDPKQAGIIEGCVKVVEAGGLDAFNSWKEKVKGGEDSHAEHLRWMGRLAFFRKRDDVLDLLLDFTCELVLQDDQANYSSYRDYAEGLSLGVTRAQGLEAKTKVLERITNRLLGPREAWTLYGDRNGAVANTIQERMGIYQQLVEPLRLNRGDLIAFSRFVAENQLWIANYVNFDGYGNLWRTAQEPDAVAKDWLASGFFEFGPSLACGREGRGALIEAMEGMARNYYSTDQTKKIGEALLKAEGTQRFWGRMLGARLTGDPKAALAELNGNAKAISKWPPHAREGIMRIIGKWFPNVDQSMDGSLRQMLTDSRRKGDAEMRKKAEAFLKDGFDDEVRPYNIDSGSFGVMMRRLTVDDPALAAKVWAKALEHFENLQGGGSSSSNGFRSTPSQYSNQELFQAFGNGENSVPGVAEFVRLLVKEKPDAASGMFDMDQSYYLRQFFDRWMRDNQSRFSSIKAVSSLKPEIRSVAGALIALHEDTKKESRGIAAAMVTGIATSNYSSSFENMGRPEMLEWVRKSFGKTDPVLARAVVISATMLMEAKKVSEDDKKAFRTAFLESIKDAGVPSELRLMVLYGVLRHSTARSWVDDPECAAAAADLLVQIVVPDHNWASSTSFSCIERFAKLANCPAADAARIMAAVKAAPPSFSSYGNSSIGAETRMTRFILSLALTAGKSDEIPRLVKEAGAALRGNLELAMTLWKANQAASAVSILARPGETYQGSRARLFNTWDSGETRLWFDRDLEAALPGWLLTIDDVEQRFRLECLLSCLEDVKGDKAPTTPRAARVEALVARFPKEAPKARVSRQEILAAFTVETAMAKPLADEYIEVAGRYKLGLLIPLRDSNSNDQATADASYATEALLRRAMRFEIEVKGDATMVLKQLESIVPIPNGNQEYYANELLGDVARWYPAFLAAQLMEQPMERRVELSSKALRLCEFLLLKERPEYHRMAVALAIVSQASIGNGAELDQWLEKLQEPQKSRYVDCRGKHGLKDSLAALGVDPFKRDEYAKSRKELIVSLFADQVTAQREFKLQSDYTLNQAGGILTDDDMLAVIDSLPENHPKRVQLMVEKGGITAWGKGKNDEALTAYQAAEAAAGEDPVKLGYAKAHHIVFLNGRLNDHEKARELAKTVNPEILPDVERKIIEKALEEPQSKKDEKK